MFGFGIDRSQQCVPRLDLVGEMSGLAPGHLAVVGKSPAMLAALLSHRDSWDVNIRWPSRGKFDLNS